MQPQQKSLEISFADQSNQRWCMQTPEVMTQQSGEKSRQGSQQKKNVFGLESVAGSADGAFVINHRFGAEVVTDEKIERYLNTAGRSKPDDGAGPDGEGYVDGGYYPSTYYMCSFEMLDERGLYGRSITMYPLSSAPENGLQHAWMDEKARVLWIASDGLYVDEPADGTFVSRLEFITGTVEKFNLGKLSESAYRVAVLSCK